MLQSFSRARKLRIPPNGDARWLERLDSCCFTHSSSWESRATTKGLSWHPEPRELSASQPVIPLPNISLPRGDTGQSLGKAQPVSRMHSNKPTLAPVGKMATVTPSSSLPVSHCSKFICKTVKLKELATYPAPCQRNHLGDTYRAPKYFENIYF